LQSPASSYEHPSDEIDLRDLILALWDARLTIIAITVAVLIGATAYAFLSTPVYETQAQTLPPPASGLQSYNTAHQMTGPAAQNVSPDTPITDAIPPLSPLDAYQLFLRHASSISLRQQFFQEHYLPYMEDDPSEAQQAALWQQFNNALTITLPRRAEDNHLMRLSLQGNDPAQIAEWLNIYLEMAITKTRAELAENLASAVAQRRKSLEDQVAILRAGKRKDREHEIARLEEALALAESINLEQPPTAGNLITSYSGETLYMRGANTLRGELRLLRNRESDDPFIPELPPIFKRLELLNNIDLAPEHIMVATIDEAARVPQHAIKPRKALILALGLVLGGMLGVFVALVRNMFREKARS